MALTSSSEVDHYVDQELRSFQVVAGNHVYKGSLVGLAASGYARALIAGDPFVGIAYEEMDNSAGSSGDLSVRVYTLGDFGMTLTGATVADIGRPVFASADDTLTFSGSGNCYVGLVQNVVSTNEIILRLDPGKMHVKTVTHAVEDLSAGVDVAARAIHAFDAHGWIVAARVVNQAAAASGIDDSNTCVVALAATGGAVATETFDSTTTFPSANVAHDMGTISNPEVSGKTVLTLAVTNGTNADPGPFIVEVDYV